MDAISNINELPAINLAQIFEKLPFQDRLKIEQVCKNWQHVGKNLSWSNYRVFDNVEYRDRPEAKQIKTFLERCGRHLRHLTLRNWSPDIVLSFIRMTPNIQHLRFSEVTLTDECLKELAGIVPGLKSLAVKVSLQGLKSLGVKEYNLGLMDFFKTMTSLEYLHIYEHGFLFGKKLYSFVQFPPNLKYLDLYRVSHTAQILSWVAEGCKDLKGLCLSGNIKEKFLQTISKMKSLTYLRVSLPRPYEMGYVFEELTELRAFETDTLDVTVMTFVIRWREVISAIVQHCKNLEHLDIYDSRHEISAEMHANILRLASLPRLCSLSICADRYSKEQTTELINRLIANGKLQYIEMKTQAPLEPEVLLEMLRRCKSTKSVDLEFGPIDSDFYSKICRVVDEIDEEDRQQREMTGEVHPIVEVQYNKILAGNMTTPYKWLRFCGEIKDQDPVVCEMWKFGLLSAGKPAWSSQLY